MYCSSSQAHSYHCKIRLPFPHYPIAPLDMGIVAWNWSPLDSSSLLRTDRRITLRTNHSVNIYQEDIIVLFREYSKSREDKVRWSSVLLRILHLYMFLREL